MDIKPYLIFEGRCDEAIEFYEKALDAKVNMLMRFKDAPDPAAGAHGVADKVMHSQVQIGDAIILMSDGQMKSKPEFKGFSLTINCADEAQARRYFDGLNDGGKVTMPLGKTFFAPLFGMVLDKFGVHWMVMVGK